MSNIHVPKNAAKPLAVKVTTAGEMLACSRQHVYNLIERGELRRLTIGSSRSVRIPVADVYAVLGLDPDEAGSS